jgi:uncharacterized SAM-dependent methyltransferase
LSSFLPIAVHESRFPGRRSEAARAAFAQGRLPGWLLYEGEGQANRWLAYHAAWSPARREDELRGLYRRAFAAAWAALGPGSPHLVSLGCGGGGKDSDALDMLPGAGGARCHYTPLDASLALVLLAAQRVTDRHTLLGCHPLVADLEMLPALDGWLTGQDGGGCRRLVTCFGMIPNLDPETFPRYVAGLLRAGDGLLISANLSPTGHGADGARILAQYDNPEARAWYLGALAALGLSPEGADLAIASRPLSNDGGWWRIEAVARPRRPVRIVVDGVAWDLAAGAPLRVFASNRFTLPAIRALLEQAGLVVAEQWIHAGGEEGIFRCGRAG